MEGTTQLEGRDVCRASEPASRIRVEGKGYSARLLALLLDAGEGLVAARVTEQFPQDSLRYVDAAALPLP